MEQRADLREWVYTLLLMVEKYVGTSPCCLGAASTVELVSGRDNLARQHPKQQTSIFIDLGLRIAAIACCRREDRLPLASNRVRADAGCGLATPWSFNCHLSHPSNRDNDSTNQPCSSTSHIASDNSMRLMEEAWVAKWAAASKPNFPAGVAVVTNGYRKSVTQSCRAFGCCYGAWEGIIAV